MLLALRKKDEGAMERSFAQLRTYYNDTRSVPWLLPAAAARTHATSLTRGRNFNQSNLKPSLSLNGTGATLYTSG